MARSNEKARRAATHPDRPGERCRAAPGVYRPVVDPGRCEGKGDCVEVCPYHVFEVGRLPEDVFRALPIGLRFKAWAHGKKTSYTPRAHACQACGLCVVACPEQAIRLTGPQA